MIDRKRYYQEYYQKHREKYKEYYQEHKEKIEKYRKEWYQKNKEKRQQYNRNWIEIGENREHKREQDRKYARTDRKLKRKLKRQISPKYRLDNNMASIISSALKGKKAGRKWETLVGYAIEDLIKHLEKQFDDKMNWDNYGSYWWIDHIKPRSLFNYTFPEDKEFKKCWSLENLQPLEKIANIKKGAKVDNYPKP